MVWLLRAPEFQPAISLRSAAAGKAAGRVAPKFHKCRYGLYIMCGIAQITFSEGKARAMSPQLSDSYVGGTLEYLSIRDMAI